MPGYRFDDVEIDAEAFRVLKRGRPVRLEPKAVELLLLLVCNPGRLVGKAEIQDAVWKGTVVTENALTRLVAQVRRALGDDAREARYIETVPTRGYRFIGELRETRADEAESAAGDRARGTVQAGRGGAWGARSFRRVTALAAVALALLVTGSVLSWRTAARNRDAVVHPALPVGTAQTQISLGDGLNAYPSFSPDGAAVAFCAQRGRSMEIVVRLLAAGAREVAVTSDGGLNVQPAFSPDGRHLAYHSVVRGGIWLVPALGGVPRQLTRFGSSPSWSPNGSRIVFQSQSWTGSSEGGAAAGEGSTLWVVGVDGGPPRRLTALEESGPGGHGSPAWSPDGGRIAFLVGWRVFTVRPDGSDLRQTSGDSWVSEVAWGADGRTQLWSGRTKQANWVVWQVDVEPDTGDALAEPKVLASGGEMASAWRQPALSPDGRWLAFTTFRTSYELLAQRVSPEGLALGAPAPLVAALAGRKFPPIFSPDGRRVAFGLLRPGEGTSLWVADVEGGDPRPVAATAEGIYPVRSWFPDGRRLAYAARTPEGDELRSVDVETGVQKTLRIVPHGAAKPYFSVPRLSLDGTALLTHGPVRGVLNLWLLPLAGGPPRALTEDRWGMGWPAWSPDGAQIAVELLRGGDTQVGLLRADGSGMRALTTRSGQSWPHSFSPDGKRIAFAGQRDGIWNVYWVPVTGGEERRLTRYETPAHYVRTPDWSPRGDLVGYEYAESTGTVWVTELPQAGSRR